MKAILLAAGKGTRLRPYTDTVPKCLMPIHGQPLLGLWLSLLATHGVTDVRVNTHHLAGQVEAYIAAQRRRRPLSITTFHEETLLGSGGTVLANRSFLDDGRDFLIAYADNLTNVDLSRMYSFHQRCRSQGVILTMGVFRAPNPSACGIVELDHHQRVVDFVEKPQQPKSNLANGGIYICTPELFARCDGLTRNDDGVVDFGTHILPLLTGSMAAFEIDAYLRDIGTIDAYTRALTEWPPATQTRQGG